MESCNTESSLDLPLESLSLQPFLQSLHKEQWQEVRLGEIVDVKHGYAFAGKNITTEHTPNVLVTPGNFHIGGGFKSQKFKYFNGEIPKSFIFSTGDIIVTMTDLSKDGDTLGYSAKIPEDSEHIYLHNQRIGLLLFLRSDICKDFIYWLLRTKNYQAFIVNSATGTSVKHTSPKLIGEYRFPLPPLTTQQKIAEILSSFDDKIDLLHRQNKTLESLALTLFRHYFIDNPKRDEWELGKLGEEFDFVMGVSPKGSSYNEQQKGVPMFQGNADFGFRFPTNRIYTDEPKKFAEKFDTLVSVRAPVGAVNMAQEKCCIGRGLSAFRHKHKDLHSYTFYKMKFLSKEFERFNDKGTIFGAISKGDFENIDIWIPPLEYGVRINQELKTIDDKIHNNTKQIQNLQAMRDVLLKAIFA